MNHGGVRFHAFHNSRWLSIKHGGMQFQAIQHCEMHDWTDEIISDLGSVCSPVCRLVYMTLFNQLILLQLRDSVIRARATALLHW